MEDFLVLYKGKEIKFKAVKNSDMWKSVTHEMDCPVCGKGTSLSPKVHTLKLENGKATLTPSLVCPFNCGFHVWVKDGIATDC